jgi:geranylgeranyl pyrophosphate synthase
MSSSLLFSRRTNLNTYMCRLIASCRRSERAVNRFTQPLAHANDRQLEISKHHTIRPYSSALPIDAIKDSIKSSLLEEAAKRDSPFWDEKHIKPHKVNGINGLNGLNGYHQLKYSKVDIEKRLSDVVDVDTPLNKPDPLDEWHLEAVSPHNTERGLNGASRPPNKKVAVRIPAGVAPLDSSINDPFVLSSPDVHDISATIGNDLVGTDHPVLNSAARYFFTNEDNGKGKGKQVRPVMVMLLSRAMMQMGTSDMPHLNNHALKSQRRLAEITEMIHTASLFHDDVIDNADTRRGKPAAHKAFGNKMAILAGDYLLARASICLARLRNVDVVECMSTVIEHLVRGEVLQIKDSRTGVADIEGYLRKNFYKTASLMAYSCKSAALLGAGHGGNVTSEMVEAAYRYGKHIGVSFQLIDDALDFEGSAISLGKPALADLNAGLSTAPVFFAAETHGDELIPAMVRKFKGEGDIDLALNCIQDAGGVIRTKELAAIHAELAIDAVVKALEPSPYRDSLVHLACRVVDRSR